jgi:serine protease
MLIFFCERKARIVFFYGFIFLFSCFNFQLASAQTVTPKRKAGSHLPAVLPQEEDLVQGLIITPHITRGSKLSAELASRKATKLAAIAEVPLIFDKSLSGRAHLLKFDKPRKVGEARAIAARLKSDRQIEIAEPDLLMSIDSITPADPGYATIPGQWHYMTPDTVNLGGTNLPDAWTKTLGSANINVAVLDTGYLPHADLAAVLPGHDFITSTVISNDGNGRDNDASDPGDWVGANECSSGSQAKTSSWHGTHIMGTIAALMNNGIDGTGIAPNVRILPVRVIGKCGGYTSDIVEAMRWAAGINVPGVARNNNPARIINLSLGASGTCSAAFQSAVNDVNAAGAIVVVASGNAAVDTVNQPANCSGVIAVTAHVLDGDNADYANIGSEVMISAPGGGCGTLDNVCLVGINNGRVVYSLGNTGTSTPLADSYALKRGTSMAAPHVAGTIALMLSLDPSLTRAEVSSILRASARPHPLGSACALTANANFCGAGLLDAKAALNAIVPTIQIAQQHQVVAPAATVSLSANVQAPAGRSITSYAWLASPSNPAAVTINQADTANASFTAPATGSYLFTLNVIDSGGATGSATATVKVNNAPVILSPPVQRVQVGESVQLQLQASDADGDIPVFYATSLPAGASLTAPGLFTWQSAVPVGSYQISIYASDNDSTSAPAVLSITIASDASTSIARSTTSISTSNNTSGGGGGGGSMEGDLTLLCGFALVACRRIKRYLQTKK